MTNKTMLFISPVRNEAEYIQKTLASIVAQTVQPSLWIIVDDGSSDDTASIVKSFSEKHSWIRLLTKPDRGVRAVGPGVVETFYFGLNTVDHNNFDFICKIDGDLELGPRYFECLLKKFEVDPKLGAASGKPVIQVNDKLVAERIHDEMVAGQINFYRTACFNQIGGFVKEVHWDAISFHRARMEGWKTKSFGDSDLQFIHLRLMGSSDKGIITGRMRWGKGQYFIGTHPLYLAGIGLYRSFEKPFLLGGLFIIVGYIRSYLKKEIQYQHPGFRESLHAWQMERMKLGRRKETIA